MFVFRRKYGIVRPYKNLLTRETWFQEVFYVGNFGGIAFWGAYEPAGDL